MLQWLVVAAEGLLVVVAVLGAFFQDHFFPLLARLIQLLLGQVERLLQVALLPDQTAAIHLYHHLLSPLRAAAVVVAVAAQARLEL